MKTETENFLDIRAMSQEKLDPELAACLTHTGGKFDIEMIAHPLVHTAFIVAGMANRQLAFKQKRLAEAIEEKDWFNYVFTHERPYRTGALLEVHDTYGLPWSEIGDLCADVWTDSENIHQHIGDWKRIRRECDIGGATWMNDEERVTLAALPEQFEIFRGECTDGDVSWSLLKEVAKFFANRGTHNSTGVTVRGTVDKKDVFCYLGRRNEEEIIVERSKVKNIFPV